MPAQEASSMFNSGKWRTTIRLTVVTVSVIGTVLTAAIAIGLQYYFGQAMARDNAADLYSAGAGSIAAELRALGTVSANVIDLLADNPALADPDKEQAQLQIFTRVLEKNPLYYGVYLGRGNGDFLELVNLASSEEARRRLLALPTDRWLVISMRNTPNGRVRHYRYLDDNFKQRAQRSEPSDYHVVDRPWYQQALASGEVEVSAPYLFAQLGVPGRTVSRRIEGTDTVVAFDTTLATLSSFLASHELAARADLYLYDQQGQVIASSIEYQYAQPPLPIPEFHLSSEERSYLQSLGPLTASNELDWPPIDYAQGGEPRGYTVDVLRMLGAMLELEINFVNGYSWQQLVEQFQRGDIQLLQPVVATAGNADWGLAGEPILNLPFALATAQGRPALQELAALQGQVLAIPSGWSILPVVRERLPGIEIVEASSTLDALQKVLAGEADAALDSEVILRYISRHYFLQGLEFHSGIDIGSGQVPDKLHILVDSNEPRLRELLDRAINTLGARQRRYLERAWLAFEPGTMAASAATVPDDLLLELAADPGRHSQLVTAARQGEEWLVFTAPVTAAQERLFLGIMAAAAQVEAPFLNKVKLSILITSGVLFLLLPLSWLFANPIVRPVRQLAAESDKVRLRQYDQVDLVNCHVKELDELSESMVNMVSAIQAHEQAQRELMDSIIKLIAQAIDEKSPYTGGHCERVPELALMLAEKASASTDPAFREFQLSSDDEWREYRIAAWLHDCGKITTPEHIVDKGSKLETIYNRLHEVRMRFEVLWRDARIEYLEELAKAPEQQPVLASALAARQSQLQSDFDFIARCNVGGEFLEQADQERLRRIGEQTWQRHFDDRIGLSPVEELRRQQEEAPLPAEEQLLADKPEHLIQRTGSTDYPEEMGINMDIPQALYNQGELYNLSISRGTLTAEDRFKINEHMISTIKMLESLPFPDELRRVPRYASTHHETMKGTGYPRKLPGEQLSIPERLLAVADVFEALTASDRPYKKAKPVSVAIDILHKMVLDNHIDRDCFELFLREGVYLDYARRYLTPTQADAVDIQRYL